MKIKHSLFCLIILSLLWLSGCREVKRSYIINPDFSGKVHLYVKTSLDPFGQLGNSTQRIDDEAAKRGVKGILDGTTGVDAWRDIVWNITDEGKLEFNGTAYFQDFNSLNLDTSTTSSNKLILHKNGDALQLQWEQVSVPPSNNKANNKELTGKVLDREIAAAKAKFKQSFAMMSAFLGEFKEEDRFVMPGSKVDIKGFTAENGNVVLKVDGKELLENINKLTSDESFWKNAVIEGKEPVTGTADPLLKQMYGAVLPFVATYSKGEPLFDYKTEVVAAKAAYPKLLEKLGIAIKPKPVPLPIAGYASFKTLKVGAVTMTFGADAERGILPNSQDNGYTLYLIGEWGGTVDSVNEAKITEAVTDSGESIIRDSSEGIFMIQSPQLSSDKSAVVVPIALKLPPQNTKALKKVSGSISFNITSEAKSHDTGLIDNVAGGKAKEFGVQIIKVDQRADKSGFSIGLQLSVDPGLIKGVSFYDDARKKLDFNGSANSCINDNCTFEYSFDGELPKRVGMIIDAYDSRQTVSTPFVLENIPVWGR